MKINELRHEFVEFIPSPLDAGVLYVSIPFATAVHLCCCGCGNKVVTPFSPIDWKLTYDGETTSLSPSIGNWAFPCRSHYWIRNDRVEWAATWSDSEIEAVRNRERRERETHYAAPEPLPEASVPERKGWLRQLWLRLRK